MHFLRGEDLAGVHLPGIQNLAAQRHDRLGLAVAGLLGRAACGIPFHQKQLTRHHILRGAIGELAGQCRAGRHALALDFLARFEAALRIADTQLGDQLGLGCMLVQPQTEGVLHHTRDEHGALP